MATEIVAMDVVASVDVFGNLNNEILVPLLTYYKSFSSLDFLTPMVFLIKDLIKPQKPARTFSFPGRWKSGSIF